MYSTRHYKILNTSFRYNIFYVRYKTITLYYETALQQKSSFYCLEKKSSHDIFLTPVRYTVLYQRRFKKHA